jgi:hypothetical protein
MTKGPRNAPSPTSILSPQFGQLGFTLNMRPGMKIVRRPQLGQRHLNPFATIRARVTFIPGQAGALAPR